MEKSVFRKFLKHRFLVGKYLSSKAMALSVLFGPYSVGSIGGMLTLNVIVQTQINAQGVQIQQWSRKTPKKKKKNLKKLVLVDHKLKLCEIAEELKISEGRIFIILHEHFSMRKLCSKLVPRLLPVDKKPQRVDDSESCLQLFQRYEKKVLRKYVTMDEMDPPLNPEVELGVSWVDRSKWRHPKRQKSQTLSSNE